MWGAQMNDKKDILESWIMVEHLSEGDINKKETFSFSKLQDGDYYKLFKDEVEKKKLKPYQKGGIVLYLGVFEFKEIIDFIRKEYKLKESEDEISLGDKFSVALYFDTDIKLNAEMTFVTESFYIRKKKSIPKESDFSLYEEEYKKKVAELFEFSEDIEYAAFFNETFADFLYREGIAVEDCYFKVLSNLETEEANLHSFFVGDLERAKHISTVNLDKYLEENSNNQENNRVDLDSKKTSVKFNKTALSEILMPRNYPLSRFPSSLNQALSFMQQVAVNLAIGFDNEQMQSVNGPPGTGKTTLLKDIFAELIAEQANEIANLPDKSLPGSSDTKYFGNAYIGVIPSGIADRGIVVASSNNGAVKNIVDEIPLKSKIGIEFDKELMEADYFTEIANSKVGTKWNEEENHEDLIILERNKESKNWGLFSLEGGRKENMDNILTVMKHVVYYLENEYVSNAEVYEDYRNQYSKATKYRASLQKKAEAVAKYYSRLEAAQKREDELKIFSDKEEMKLSSMDGEQKLVKKNKQIEIDRLESLNEAISQEIEENKESQKLSRELIDNLKLRKPGLFASRAKRAEYKELKNKYSAQYEKLLRVEMEKKNELSHNKTQIDFIKKEIEEKEAEFKRAHEEYELNLEKKKSAILKLKEEAEELKGTVNSLGGRMLDFTVDYDVLQESNPWFDSEYRKIQSDLFIMALKVRKQFLYENTKSIKAAYIIWNKQKDYIDNKKIIEEAWHWINMVIPVISSTFASFSRMCTLLGPETMGCLFVDEAGQALPQASVGAIYRNKQVMVVGDPSQIKPVLTLDSSILSMLGNYFNVSEKYLSSDASVQTLVDSESKFGFYKDTGRTEWIGIPLWVHRRCKYPMFSIANRVSYGGNMVQGVKAYGKSKWYDVGGQAKDKYVAEQGAYLKDIIKGMIKDNPDIVDKSKDDVIYVITPFKNVAYHLSLELKKIGFTRYDEKGKPTNIGTVHTFQGKEAPIVFLVLGADEKSKGAANWAMGSANPNIMNVAATRAKNEFYIIGDKKLYMSLKSDVIKATCEEINNYIK